MGREDICTKAGGKDKLKSRMQRNKESAAASRERARLYTHSLELKVAALEDTVRILTTQLAAALNGGVSCATQNALESVDESCTVVSNIDSSAVPRQRRAATSTSECAHVEAEPSQLRQRRLSSGRRTKTFFREGFAFEDSEMEVSRVRRHRSVSVGCGDAETTGWQASAGGSNSSSLAGSKRHRVQPSGSSAGACSESSSFEDDTDERSVYELEASSRGSAAPASASISPGSRASSAPVDVQQLLLPPPRTFAGTLATNTAAAPAPPGALYFATSTTTTERRDRDHQSAALVLACGFSAVAAAAELRASHLAFSSSSSGGIAVAPCAFGASRCLGGIVSV